jgi:hypothetical protein
MRITVVGAVLIVAVVIGVVVLVRYLHDNADGGQAQTNT